MSVENPCGSKLCPVCCPDDDALRSETRRADTAEAALVKVQKEMAAVHALSYRCQAWIEGEGQCAERATMLLQFTGAIAVRVDVCAGHYSTELAFRQGDL